MKFPRLIMTNVLENFLLSQAFEIKSSKVNLIDKVSKDVTV